MGTFGHNPADIVQGARGDAMVAYLRRFIGKRLPPGSEIAIALGLTGQAQASEEIRRLELAGRLEIERRPGSRMLVAIDSGRGSGYPGDTLRRVERDPCPRCGTRGDLGCSHRRAA